MAPLLEIKPEERNIPSPKIYSETEQQVQPQESLLEKLAHPEGKYNFLMDMDESALDPHIRQKVKEKKVFQASGLNLLKMAGKTAEMGKMILTGTQRVAGEFIADINKNLTGRKSIEIKNPALKTFLGTEQLTPISTQFQEAYKRYGLDAVTAIAMVFLKTTEALGPTALSAPKRLPFKTKAGDYIIKGADGAIHLSDMPSLLPGEKLITKTIHSGASIPSAIQYWKDPIWNATIGRLMRKEVSPLVKFVGEKKFLEMEKLGTNIENGVVFSEQAKYAEIYARQMALEESYKGHYPENLRQFILDDKGKRISNPAYWEAVKKVPDEKVAQMLARGSADPIKTVHDGYANFHANAEIDGLNLRNLVSDVDGASMEFMDSIEVKVREKLNSSEIQSWLTKEKPAERIKIRERLEESFRSYYYDEALGGKPQSGPQVDLKNLMDKKPVQDIVAVKIPEQRIIQNAQIWMSEQGWLEKGYSIGSLDLQNFFKEFPEYRQFTPRIYDAWKNGKKLPNSQMAIENILNPEINLLHFKEGTPEFQMEMNLKAQGRGFAEGPETIKGNFAEQQKSLELLGYKDIIRPASPKEMGGKIAVDFEAPTASLLEKGRRAIRDMIVKTGFSPEAVVKDEVIMAINKRFAEQMKGAGFKTITNEKGKVYLIDEARRKLFQYASDKAPENIAQMMFKGIEHPFYGLKVSEIAEVLKVDNATAKALQTAVRTSRNIEAQYVGGAVKLVNQLRYGKIPVLSKAYNDFTNLTIWTHFPTDAFMSFRYFFKSTVLNSVFNKAPVNIGKMGYWLDKTIKRFPMMERLGYKGFFGTKPTEATYQLIDAFMEERTSGLLDPVNEGEIMGGMFKGKTERMIWLKAVGIKMNDLIAGQMETFARLRGFTSKLNNLSAQQFDVINQVYKIPELRAELTSHISDIFHYGEKGYLQSPMAKSLNVMAYPSRFSTKVLLLTTRWLDTLPPIAQNIMLNQLGAYILWTKTDEAKEFYKKNWRWIQAVNWVQPFSHIGEMYKDIFKGDVGSLGMIGGLPAGFFFDIILKELGVRKSVYTSMETGAPSQQHLVRGLNRQIAVDFFGGTLKSLFSYPIYTLSNPLVSAGVLKEPIHSPISKITDWMGEAAGTREYGQSNILNEFVIPRPERLVPEDMAEPWKWLLEQMTLDSKENPDMYGGNP